MIVLFLVALTAAQSFDATFRIPELQANNGWLYLETFHFTPHLAKLELIVNVVGKATSEQPQNLIIQGIPASEWEQEQELKCASMLRMPVVMQELNMDGRETSGIFQFAVEKEQSYSFVVKDCHQMLNREYNNAGLAIRIRMKVLSNEADPAYTQKEEEIHIVSATPPTPKPQEL